MELYADLLESMVDCCARFGMRHGPIYTVAVLILSLGTCLYLLSAVQILSTLGLVEDPYTRGLLHAQHSLYALIYAVFLLNILLARIKFGMDRAAMRDVPDLPTPAWSVPRFTWSRHAAPIFLTGAACLFCATLMVDLLNRG